MDRELRELERQAATGDRTAMVRLVRARRRASGPPRSPFVVAATRLREAFSLFSVTAAEAARSFTEFEHTLQAIAGIWKPSEPTEFAREYPAEFPEE